MKPFILLAILACFMLVTVAGDAVQPTDRAVVIFSSNLHEHIKSQSENATLACCILPQLKKYRIRSFFFESNDTPDTELVNFRIQRILNRIDELKPKLVVVYGDRAFKLIAAPHLYGNVPVYFISVHKQVVSDSKVALSLLSGEVLGHDTNKVEMLFKSRNIPVNGWTVIHSPDRLSLDDLETLKKDIPNITTIRVESIQELKRQLFDLNQKDRMFVVNLVHELKDVDRLKVVYSDDVAEVFTRYNKKHVEVSFHKDYTPYGFLLSITHRNNCRDACNVEATKEVKELREELVINRNRATALGFGSLFNKLEYIDEVQE